MEDTNRQYWNMEIEPKLNTEEMKALQLPKLKEALKWQYENTPFNRDRLDKAGVKTSVSMVEP